MMINETHNSNAMLQRISRKENKIKRSLRMINFEAKKRIKKENQIWQKKLSEWIYVFKDFRFWLMTSETN